MPTPTRPTTTEEGIEHILRGLETVAETGGYREQVAALETAVAMRWLDNFGAELHHRRTALVEELADEVADDDVPEDVPGGLLPADDEHDDDEHDDEHAADETGSVAAELNLNADAGREKIIFGEVHGVTEVTQFGPGATPRPATGLTPDQARRLMREDYLHPADRQNDSPTAEVLVGTAEAINRNTSHHTTASLGGYIVPRGRPDARVSLTALEVTHDPDTPPEERDTAGTLLDGVTDDAPPDYADHNTDRRVVWWD